LKLIPTRLNSALSIQVAERKDRRILKAFLSQTLTSNTHLLLFVIIMSLFFLYLLVLLIFLSYHIVYSYHIITPHPTPTPTKTTQGEAETQKDLAAAVLKCGRRFGWTQIERDFQVTPVWLILLNPRKTQNVGN
jgi:hypothetical protein